MGTSQRAQYVRGRGGGGKGKQKSILTTFSFARIMK
jgi:hypothetical protein